MSDERAISPLVSRVVVGSDEHCALDLLWGSSFDDDLVFEIRNFSEQDAQSVTLSRQDVKRLLTVAKFWMDQTGYWGHGL